MIDPANNLATAQWDGRVASGVDVSELSYRYRHRSDSFEVLSNISFQVAPGELVSIVGPSGCGKSTLLRCISGLLPAQSGLIRIAGLTPAEAVDQGTIGFAFQEPALLSWRTVEANIRLPAEVGSHRPHSHVADQRVDELLHLTGLEEFRTFLPDQLSGGMRQRVSLARALFTHPSLLILDEPFGSLDLLTRTRLSVELARLVRHTMVTAVLVTHSIEEAVFLSSRVLILSPLPGRVVGSMSVNLPPVRDASIQQDIAFMNIVTQCRQVLLENWDQE